MVPAVLIILMQSAWLMVDVQSDSQSSFKSRHSTVMINIPHISAQMMVPPSHILLAVMSLETVILLHTTPISQPSTTVISTVKSVPLSRP